MNEITGYRNAPNVKPRIGDVVFCGLPGGTATVKSIDDFIKPGTCFINCAFDGKLHLNWPGNAFLFQTVDGVSYR